jgi:hemerythrin
MAISWDESLATGSAVIDQQHRKLISEVAALADAMKQGKGRHEIDAILDFLGQYVVRHFSEEEKLMEEVDCPAAAANKQEHTQFLSKYGEFRQRFAAAGAGPSLVLEMHTMLSNWLVRHIKGTDIRLRKCVGNAGRQLAGAAN